MFSTREFDWVKRADPGFVSDLIVPLIRVKPANELTRLRLFVTPSSDIVQSGPSIRHARFYVKPTAWRRPVAVRYLVTGRSVGSCCTSNVVRHRSLFSNTPFKSHDFLARGLDSLRASARVGFGPNEKGLQYKVKREVILRVTHPAGYPWALATLCHRQPKFVGAPPS